MSRVSVDWSLLYIETRYRDPISTSDMARFSNLHCVDYNDLSAGPDTRINVRDQSLAPVYGSGFGAALSWTPFTFGQTTWQRRQARSELTLAQNNAGSRA